MTQRRANGVAPLISSIVLAVVSVRGGGFHDREFLIGGVVLLAVGGFAERRRRLLAGIEAATAPTTTLRWTTFELAAHAARVACGALVVGGVLAATLDGWNFGAAALAGAAVEMLFEAEWLRYLERRRGSRLLEEPDSFGFERTKEWRPWRRSKAAPEPVTFYLDPAAR